MGEHDPIYHLVLFKNKEISNTYYQDVRVSSFQYQLMDASVYLHLNTILKSNTE